MTVEDARKFLKGSRKDVKLDALEVVSLSEKELFVIQLRYITGLTQEKAADRLPLLYAKILSLSEEDAKREYSISPNGLQKVEYRALKKCADAWTDNPAVLGKTAS